MVMNIVSFRDDHWESCWGQKNISDIGSSNGILYGKDYGKFEGASLGYSLVSEGIPEIVSYNVMLVVNEDGKLE